MMKKYFLPILLLLSSILIFYKFTVIPTNLALDEVEFAKIALVLGEKSYVPYTSYATGHSTLYFYLILLSFKLFGINTFALRLPAALFGIGSALMIYFVFKEIWNRKDSVLPFLGALFFLFSRWYFNFSRFAFEATFLIFLELTALLFLFKFLRKVNAKELTLTAVFSGLAFHSYYPGRIFFLLPLVALLIKKYFRQTAYFLLIFLIVASPLLIYNFQHPAERVGGLLITNVGMLFDNLKKLALMFVANGDMNGRHNFPGKPSLNPIQLLLFVPGLFLAFKGLKKTENYIFLIYFLLGIIPVLISLPSQNPNMLRSVTVLPPIAYFSVLTTAAFFHSKFLKSQKLRIVIIVILFVLSSLYELRTYFAFQSRVFRNSFEITCSLTKVKDFDIHAIPKNCRVQKNEF